MMMAMIATSLAGAWHAYRRLRRKSVNIDPPEQGEQFQSTSSLSQDLPNQCIDNPEQGTGILDISCEDLLNESIIGLSRHDLKALRQSCKSMHAMLPVPADVASPALRQVIEHMLDDGNAAQTVWAGPASLNHWPGHRTLSMSTPGDGYLHVSECGKYRRNQLDEVERSVFRWKNGVMATVFRTRITPVLKLRLGPHAAAAVAETPKLMPALQRIFTEITIEVLDG